MQVCAQRTEINIFIVKCSRSFQLCNTVIVSVSNNVNHNIIYWRAALRATRQKYTVKYKFNNGINSKNDNI